MSRTHFAAIAALTVALSACGAATRAAAPPTAATATAAPATAPAATPAPAAAPPEPPSEFEQNAEWAPQALEDANALIAIFTRASNASGAGEMIAACADLTDAAVAFGAHAPDTAAGRHAKTASALYVQAAAKCVAGDFEGATALLEAGGVEMDATTAALS